MLDTDAASSAEILRRRRRELGDASVAPRLAAHASSKERFMFGTGGDAGADGAGKDASAPDVFLLNLREGGDGAKHATSSCVGVEAAMLATP